MKTFSRLLTSFSLPTLALASCVSAESGESTAASSENSAGDASYSVTPMGTFDEPWAIEFVPGTAMLAITEKSGTLKMMDTETGEVATLTGAPQVAYGGQGGLGDIIFPQDEADQPLDGRTVYLSWAEAGESGDVFGAAVGKGTLDCPSMENCGLAGLEIIWRQTPKVPGRGHYSHRLKIAPDGQHLYIASGDRQKQDPAQNRSNTLGTIVRLDLDGTASAGNPYADEGGVTDQIWSWGHRNILGMDWDAEGRLWETEHGPAGGDELNVVEKGANYGWPARSNGENYNGTPIPDHTPDDGFEKPAISWTPVIAPGDMIIYSGDMFGPWKGDALITGLKTKALIRVDLEGTNASEAARYDFGERLRSIAQGPDGAIWIAEDGDEGRILRMAM